jgi:hypothetical protein
MQWYCRSDTGNNYICLIRADDLSAEILGTCLFLSVSQLVASISFDSIVEYRPLPAT